MPRTRKIPVKQPSKENELESKQEPKPKSKEKPSKKFKQEPKCMQGDGLIVSQIILSVQKTDCNSAKSIKELRKLYTKMGHEAFLASFMNMVMLFLMRSEHDEFAPRVLKFIGLFVASFGEENDDDGNSHPIIKSVFDEILSITSKLYFIRARICSLVMQIMTSFSQRAEIDEALMDAVIARMIGVFLKDISPVVRQNAIMALQRLQDPDHGEDQVTKAYLYHMEADPVAKVRQSVVTAIAKKINTIPHVIERLRDNDEKVRRHTYLQMASYPVKSYKIRDRINIMTAGLYDRSEMVKKVVNNVLLPNWLASYDNNFVEYIKAIKLDANDQEVKKFRDLAQDALNAVFKKFKVADLFKFLNISSENEYSNCLSIERTSKLEWLIVWKVAIKFHQDYVVGKQKDEHDEEAGEKSMEDEMISSIENMEIVPELSVFCDYMEKFVNNFKVNSTDADAKLRIMTFNHCLIVLLEIAQMNDFSDEIGRNRLQTTLKKVLMEHEVSDHAIKEIAHVIEQLVPGVEVRLKFFNDIVTDLLKLGSPTEYSRQTIIEDLIGKADGATELVASSLKMRMMELKEAERKCVESKRYAEAHKVSEEYAKKNAELVELLRPFAEQSTSSSQTIVDSLSSVIVAKKATPVEVIKNLRICYYAIVAKGVKSLTPEIHKTYNSFVRFHLESTDVAARTWALKTATAYSLLYESLAKEVYDILKSQLFKSTNYQIWEVTIECIVDLLLRYSIEKMDRYDLSETETSTNNITQGRSRKGGRTLYTDDGEDEEEMDFLSSVSIMQLMSHLMENNLELKVHKTILVGFCKLILHGQYCTREIISKFLLAYFNPATNAEINQILGIFFENIIKKKKQEYLEEALVPTLVTLLEAPHDSPLHEVKQETVIRYVIGATRPIFCSNGLNLHNTLCLKLIDVMKTNPENKDIIRVFSRELMTLEIGDDPLLKKDIIAQIDVLLDVVVADARTTKNITDFRDVLKGTYKPPLKFSSTGISANIMEEDEAGIPEETEEDEAGIPEEVEDDESAIPEKVEADESAIPEEVEEDEAGISEEAEGGEDTPVEVIALDEVLDGSASQTNIFEIIVNVRNVSKFGDESSITSLDATDVTMSEVPDTPTNMHSQSQELTLSAQELEESLDETSDDDDEADNTVLEVTTVEASQTNDEVIEATPDQRRVSARGKTMLANKRQLELSVTKNSPIRKNPRNGDSPKPTSSGNTSITLNTPSSSKASKRSALLSTPNTDRLTRQQTKDDMAQKLTLTRSASKKMNIDVVTVDAKAEAQKNITDTAKPSKMGKKEVVPVPTKTSILRAAKVESKAVKKPSATEKKSSADSGEPSTSKMPSPSRKVTRQRTTRAQEIKQRPRWN